VVSKCRIFCIFGGVSKSHHFQKADWRQKNRVKLLSTLGHTLSEKEMGFVEEVLESRAVPTPKLLIKDHKPMNSKGEYMTRLIVPATNFKQHSQRWDTWPSKIFLTKMELITQDQLSPKRPN
jgi:hypothetical protein